MIGRQFIVSRLHAFDSSVAVQDQFRCGDAEASFRAMFRQPIPKSWAIELREGNVRHIHRRRVSVSEKALDDDLPSVFEVATVERFIERAGEYRPPEAFDDPRRLS